tara:strand:- start:304 stop:633 length:330 start_codon:yes stop_codon:yes gene_type:complete
MADILDNVSVNSNDASVGLISLSTYESYLQSDLRKAKNLYDNQLSLTPNTENVTSHNYFLDAMEDLIDGLDYAILGIQQNDVYYIEVGITFIDSSGNNSILATSTLSEC